MPPITVLSLWLLDGRTPAHLTDDIVVGSIRWQKVLGMPDGKLDAAFFVDCYHIDRQAINNEQTVQLRNPHKVDLWEGPHEDHYFRVSFITDARTPKGYDFGSSDPLRNVNLLKVRFHTGVAWSNNTFTGKGRKSFVPAQLTFDPPGKAQRLPDINVVHLQPSVLHP